jgi:hypothetical protein
MTAEIIDFAEAKAKILGRGSVDEPKTVTPALSSALEEFSFSRLPKLERITRTIITALNNGRYAVAPPLDEIVIHLAKQLETQLPENAFFKPLLKT